MNSLIYLGAINNISNSYESPFFAIKENNYRCPDCNNDVILRKGKQRIPHFAHYNEEIKCDYYKNPSETQIHKDAKMLLKYIIDNNYQIKFKRICKNECCFKKYKIKTINETSKIIIEHRFKFNNLPKIADVAYIEENNLSCIFEIFVTHKTEEYDRPEPWFEIDGNELLQINLDKKVIKLSCQRLLKCKNKYKEFLNQIPKLTKICDFNKDQQKYCLECCKSKYKPLVFSNQIYSICENCCKNYYNEIYQEYIKEYQLKIEQDKKDKLEKIPVIYKFSREPFYGCSGCHKKFYSPIKYNNKYYAVCADCKKNKINFK